jgi:Snare region anchored in the vesicle membrane C-terminus
LSSAYPQELGVSILNDLHRQRQTITNARDTLHGADDNIATARRVLATMSRRLMTNKLIMGGVCQHCNVGQLGVVRLHLLHDHMMYADCFIVFALQESACFSWCDSSSSTGT